MMDPTVNGNGVLEFRHYVLHYRLRCVVSEERTCGAAVFGYVNWSGGDVKLSKCASNWFALVQKIGRAHV